MRLTGKITKGIVLLLVGLVVMGKQVKGADQSEGAKYRDLHYDENATMDKLLGRPATILLPPADYCLGKHILKRKWDFSAADKGNFTLIENVADVKADSKDNILSFKLTKDTGLLGWGNYANKLPLGKRKKFWKEPIISFQIKQSIPEKTDWVIHLWSNGKRISNIYRPWHRIKDKTGHSNKHCPIKENCRKNFYEPSSDGTEWQTVKFSSPISNFPVDGFDLEIKGKPGNTILFKDLKIYQRPCAGYVRKTFTLPPGKIWSVAIAQRWLFDEQTLYINGKEADADDKNIYKSFNNDIGKSIKIDTTKGQITVKIKRLKGKSVYIEVKAGKALIQKKLPLKTLSEAEKLKRLSSLSDESKSVYAGVHAMRARKYTPAEKHFKKPEFSPLHCLTNWRRSVSVKPMLWPVAAC